MSYDFHLISDQDPRLGLFDRASAQFENKFTLVSAENSADLIIAFNGEDLALLSAPQRTANEELQRIFGADVAGQLKGDAWVSEVSCAVDKEDAESEDADKETAESVRAFLMITVIGTKGLVVDPQANQVLNAGWGP
ncbi:hypothetical protein SRABI83_01655 [Arthrobacter sp. Bi83]|uniref:hypothetical protein n=1 Tax=Arthrobacter sp. Bi83 TaxID=2822353 RepID=UPI001D588689|nr:hypothetical protein [Arthrobacter sp. Bi83]CAH0190553.1 hypothetical protein SRABI83_01655 [Arthrobacter sp. Bi83]